MRTFWRRHQEGTSTLEYAILVCAIAISIISGSYLLGGTVSSKFAEAAQGVAAASPDNPTSPAEIPDRGGKDHGAKGSPGHNKDGKSHPKNNPPEKDNKGQNKQKAK